MNFKSCNIRNIWHRVTQTVTHTEWPTYRGRSVQATGIPTVIPVQTVTQTVTRTIHTTQTAIGTATR